MTAETEEKIRFSLIGAIGRSTLRWLRRLLWMLVGAVAGMVVLYVVLAPGGDLLRPWHTEFLDGEFSVNRDDVNDFAAYLALEERLFDELASKFYAQDHVPAGAELMRYVRGSRVDPFARQPNWNHSFEWVPERPARGAVLLLHGMSDSPYSLRALGEALRQRDFHVIGLRAPGHGTVPSGLVKVTWEDMAAAVQLAMDHLAATVGADRVHIIGYSTGASLAVDYTLNVMAAGSSRSLPKSLVLVSPAMGVTPAAAFAKWTVLAASIPGLRKLAWTSLGPEFDPYKYNSFTANAGAQVRRITVSTTERLLAMSAAGPIEGFPPTLAFLSTVDATVSTQAVADTMRQLAADCHELVLFDIDRSESIKSILVSDPGPLTNRLLQDTALPFALTLVANENPQTTAVEARYSGPLSATLVTRPLDQAWPRDVISLSHVALPFPSDDPLYGRRSADRPGDLSLGEVDLRGERGLLQFPADWLMRLRFNPFYDYVEQRVLGWLGAEDLIGNCPAP